jgi:sulfatase maturation enzyme AslB (radical SAM superfamily)
MTPDQNIRRKETANGVKPIYRAMRGWLFPYVRSRVLPGDFHPITSYLFVESKCNLDCWYCWSFDNRVKGMSEDVARRSIDWLYDLRPLPAQSPRLSLAFRRFPPRLSRKSSWK